MAQRDPPMRNEKLCPEMIVLNKNYYGVLVVVTPDRGSDDLQGVRLRAP